MRKLPSLAAALILVGTLVPAAHGQNAAPHGNVAAGRAFALNNCDACHLVASQQQLPPVANYGPSFFNIANKPTTTAESLVAFLGHPHGYTNMPYPDLAPQDLANVVAYILSLRGQR